MSTSLEDPARLAALRRTALLDSPPAEGFDRLTRLATAILHAPVALVSLVDADRQFFPSCVGLPEPWASARETPLSHSFCQHTLASRTPLVIPDARFHPLVCASPAIADLGVVAYAGIPLVTSDGHVLGSFCVIDHQPRDWTAAEIALLRDLAGGVMTEIELRAAVAERVTLLAAARRAHAAAERARAAAEQHQGYLRQIFAQAPALIALIVGPRHVFEYVNSVYAQIVGRTEATLVGRPVREAFPGAWGHDLATMLDAVSRTGQPYHAVEVLQRPAKQDTDTSEEAYVTVVYQPLRDAAGHVAGILCHGVEVTEEVSARRRAEALTRQQAADHARLQQVLDALPEGVLLADTEGQCILCNRAASTLLGQDLVGRPLAVTASEHGAYWVRRRDGTAYERPDLPEARVLRGEVIQGEQFALGAIPILLNGAPLRDDTGAVTGALLVFQDMTVLTNVERARDALLATVSHDLKTPLAAIQGLAELSQRQAVREQTAASERMAGRQAGIVTAVTQTTDVLNDLLDFLRLQMGQALPLNRRPTDLVLLARQVVAYQQDLTGRPLTLDVDARVSAMIAVVDADRIARVIGTLLAMVAYDRGARRDVRLGVTCSHEDNPAWAVLTLGDAGMRHVAGTDAHPVDLFARGQHNSASAGTEIGLTSVRAIVQQHGGTVQAARGDNGTTITLRLPL